MRQTRNVALLLAILLSTGLAAQAATPADLAPEETLVYVEVRDLTRLQAAWETTPFHQLWSGEKFQPFLKPLKDKLQTAIAEIEAEQGAALASLKKHFPGEIAIFLSNISDNVQGEPKGVTYYDIGLIARIDPEAKAEVKKLIEEKIIGEDLPDGVQRSKDDFKGATIFNIRYREPIEPDGDAAPSGASQALGKPPMTGLMNYEYAFVDDLVIILEGPSAFMKKILTNYSDAKEGKTNSASLAATANYQQAISPLLGKKTLTPADGDLDIVAYGNLERLIQQAAVDANDPEQKKQFDSFGVSELKSLLVATRIAPGGLEIDINLSTTPSPKGLASLLINDMVNSYRSQRLAPQSATAYTSLLFDFGQVYQLVRAIGQQVGGDDFIQGIKGFEAQIEQTQGLKIYENLLAPLKGEIAFIGYSAAAQDGALAQASKTIVLFELTDDTKYAENLSKLLNMFLPMFGASIAPIEFEGFTIYPVKMNQAASVGQSMIGPMLAPCFASADKFLIIGGDPEDIKEILRRVKGGGGDDLRKNETFTKLTAQLKPGHTWLMWSDLSKSLEDGLRQFQSNAMMLMAIGQYVDVTAMPAPKDVSELFGQSGGGVYVTPESFRYNGVITWPTSAK